MVLLLITSEPSHPRRDTRATMASWHGRPGHVTKLDRSCTTNPKILSGRKGFFFTKSSRSWRSSRLRGESWAGLSPRRREAREENATSKTRQRRRPHIANAVRRRQRRDVQQQARGAVFRRRRRQTDTVAAH